VLRPLIEGNRKLFEAWVLLVRGIPTWSGRCEKIAAIQAHADENNVQSVTKVMKGPAEVSGLRLKRGSRQVIAMPRTSTQ